MISCSLWRRFSFERTARSFERFSLADYYAKLLGSVNLAPQITDGSALCNIYSEMTDKMLATLTADHCREATALDFVVIAHDAPNTFDPLSSVAAHVARGGSARTRAFCLTGQAGASFFIALRLAEALGSDVSTLNGAILLLNQGIRPQHGFVDDGDFGVLVRCTNHWEGLRFLGVRFDKLPAGEVQDLVAAASRSMAAFGLVPGRTVVYASQPWLNLAAVNLVRLGSETRLYQGPFPTLIDDTRSQGASRYVGVCHVDTDGMVYFAAFEVLPS